MFTIYDQCILQDDLEELTAWSTKWLLTFHPYKCKVMHLGKPLEEQFKYTLHAVASRQGRQGRQSLGAPEGKGPPSTELIFCVHGN